MRSHTFYFNPQEVTNVKSVLDLYNYPHSELYIICMSKEMFKVKINNYAFYGKEKVYQQLLEFLGCFTKYPPFVEE